MFHTYRILSVIFERIEMNVGKFKFENIFGQVESALKNVNPQLRYKAGAMVFKISFSCSNSFKL